VEGGVYSLGPKGGRKVAVGLIKKRGRGEGVALHGSTRGGMGIFPLADERKVTAGSKRMGEKKETGSGSRSLCT